MEFNAWFPSSGPNLVIYDDGLVIYQAPKEILVRKKNDYLWVKDFRYMAARVQDPTAFIRSLFPYKWAALKPRYELSAATDQVTTLLWHDGQIVEVYGDWRHFLEPNHYQDYDNGKEMVEIENKLRRSLPATFRQFLFSLDQFAGKEEVPWLPKFIEMGLFKYDRAVSKLPVWPADFPKPINVRQGPLQQMVTADIILPGGKYPEFQKLLSETSYPGVVAIGDTKYIVTNFVFPFPGQEVWEQDLAKKQEREKAAWLKEIEQLPPEKRKEMRKMLDPSK